MTKRVVFLCYHGIGHINPCFPLARLLEKEGHAVTLATVSHFREYVRRAGFAHYSLKSVPFGLGFEWWLNTERKATLRYWAALRDRYRDQLYHEREQDLLALINHLQPDVVFIDGTQATDFIVLYPVLKLRRIAPAMLHAMFPTHVLPGRPPANSLLVPGDPREEATAVAWMKRKLNRADLRQRLLYFGLSDRYLINRRARLNQVPTRFRLPIPSLFDFQVANIPAFILAPRTFDYPDFDTLPDHHYIGFMHAESPLASDARWPAVASSIRERRATGSRLVYCSFGTTGEHDTKAIDAFMLRLADAVTRQQDMLVIAMGTRQAAPQGLERENVWVFPAVHQTDVLRYSDVFVTHGGLSSIKEAIEAVVPMLMIPVHRQFDPPGNAARVQFHGMGVLGDISADTQQLRAQLDLLMNNRAFRTRIEAFRTANRNEHPGQFLEIFNSLREML